jgi:xanthine dehydrogenase YagR molybdenum-binding subunit
MATKTIKIPKVVDGVTTVVDIQVEDYGNSSWGPNNKHRLINSRMPRADAPFKTTGTAVYTHDVRVKGMLFGKMLLSPHAHATVKSIDLTAAQKIPGVKAVLGVDVNTELRYEGQPVASVAALTPELADDGIRAILVEYNVVPHVVKGDDALKPNAPPVTLAQGGGAGAGRGRGGRGGGSQGTAAQVDAELAKCDAVIEAEYRTPILHHCCMESHSIVVDYTGGNSATIYSSTQGTFNVLADAARELGIPQGNVTSIVQHMGGGFGSKGGGIGIVGQWACRLSKQLSLPVKMVMDRRQEFIATGNGPGSIQRVKAGANKDGTLVAVSSIQYTLAGLGRNNVAPLPYQYSAQTVYREQNSLITNEDASVPLRAPGHPQANFASESMMDELAHKLQIDPLEFRKKNAPQNGMNIAWQRQLDRGAKEIGWERRSMTPGAVGEGSLRRGLGCGIGAWGGGGRAQCVVTVDIKQDGSVTAAVGSQDLGTGTRTFIRAIVAEELGLDMPDVLELIGNSKYGNANNSGGSTTAASLSPAVKDAAYKARIAMSQLVAPLLGADPDAVYFDGKQVMGGGKALSWKQACQALPAAGISAKGEFIGSLAGNGAHGASFAEVEVDIETGHVRVIKMVHVQDAGLPLSRLTMESQINGGMIQSMGMALFEGRVMDGDLGVMVNCAFNDYKMPGTLEIPMTVPVIDDEDPRQVVIGCAEPSNIPGVGAIANAIFNACGVRVREVPITPDKILNGLTANAKA